jgi:hypothetical protein
MEDDQTGKLPAAGEGTQAQPSAVSSEGEAPDNNASGSGDGGGDTSDTGGDTSDRAGDRGNDDDNLQAGSKRSISSRWGSLDEEEEKTQGAAAVAAGAGKKRKKQKKGADAAAEGEVAAWVQQEFSKIDQQLAELDGEANGAGVKGILFTGERGSGEKKKKVRWPDEAVLEAEPVVGFRIAAPPKQVGEGPAGHGGEQQHSGLGMGRVFKPVLDWDLLHNLTIRILLLAMIAYKYSLEKYGCTVLHS